jgi:hypothetical protein
LRLRAFFFWNSDARENVKLLDVNFVREWMRFVRHRANLNHECVLANHGLTIERGKAIRVIRGLLVNLS